MKLLGFSKKESLFVVITVSVISIFIFFNLQVSLRKSRDFQRKEDISNIRKIVSMFQDKYGSLPTNNKDGLIVGCNPKENSIGGFDFEACPWGDEIMPGVRIPVDPQNDLKRGYRYITNGKKYQIYGSLESKNEPEYDKRITLLKLACGNKICNIGVSANNIPVHMTLEEYEASLLKELR